MPEAFTAGRNRSVLAALWLALYGSFALLSPALLDDADSVHAEVSREMLQRHDPVTLYANGIRYLEKAPVLYWSMAGSMRLFGVGTAQARLPLALFALLLFLLTEAFARRIFGSARAGIYAGAGLLLSFGLFIFTRILIPDAIVCLWFTSAVFCFWLTERNGEGRVPLLPCLGFGAACAMNILTKGLIGLVFPIGTVLLYLVITRGFAGTIHRIRQLHPVRATLVFLAVGAPWHVLAGLANPTEGNPAGLTHTGPAWIFWQGWQVGSPAVGSVHGWTWFYFMNEHLLRYLNLRVPRDYDTVPLLLFWGLVLVWMMPWSGFLFHAVMAAPWRALRSRATATRLHGEARTLLLLAIAGLLPLVFFSFSTRQEYYVLPSLPFFAILIARWLDREVTEAEAMTVPPVLTRAGQRISVLLLVGGTIASLTCVFFLMHTQRPPSNVDLATLLRQNPGDYALSFGHFLDLNGPAMGAFRRPLILTAAALFGSTLANWWSRRSFHPHQGNMALAAGTLVFLVAAHMGLTIFAPVLSSQKLARAIAPMLRPNNLICINDEYEAGSTLGFYLKRSDVHIWHGHSANLWYGSFFTDAPEIFETDASMRLRWLGPQRIFLWTDPAKLPALPGKAYVVAEGGGKEIVSNKAGDY